MRDYNDLTEEVEGSVRKMPQIPNCPVWWNTDTEHVHRCRFTRVEFYDHTEHRCGECDARSPRCCYGNDVAAAEMPGKVRIAEVAARRVAAFTANYLEGRVNAEVLAQLRREYRTWVAPML